MDNKCVFCFQDLFFKYSLNNFLHEQVKECIRLVFAWNNSVLPGSDECPKSPTAIRVKTPPTVEMIDPQNEDLDKIDDNKSSSGDSEDGGLAEKNQKTSNSSEDINQDVAEKNIEETKTETETKSEPEIAIYDNPLLVHVSLL